MSRLGEVGWCWVKRAQCCNYSLWDLILKLVTLKRVGKYEERLICKFKKKKNFEKGAIILKFKGIIFQDPKKPQIFFQGPQTCIFEEFVLRKNKSGFFLNIF